MKENVSHTGNATVDDLDFANPWVILRALMLVLLIFITIIGNLFVIAVIVLERNLQCVANSLIVSLAVADLLVACLVMPLGAVYEINARWSLGSVLCNMWTSCDVLCCTASILHLVAIAIDRYWAVTDLNYIQARNPRRIVSLIVIVWVVSFGISLPPQFGWRDPDYLDRIAAGQCLVSQDRAYQIFATCATFYLPLFVILFLYWRIFQTARKRIRRRPGTIVQPPRERRGILRLVTRRQREESTAFTITRSTPDHSSISPEKSSSYNDGNAGQSTAITALPTTAESMATTTTTTTTIATATATSSSTITITTTSTTNAATSAGVSVAAAATTTAPSSSTSTVTTTTTLTPTPRQQGASSKRTRETIESKRERKAAKTLAIITGAFVACWLPFFLVALLRAICRSCEPPEVVANVFLWLGYFNSTLNPVIYTVFSPQFRQGFKKMLCRGTRVTR